MANKKNTTEITEDMPNVNAAPQMDIGADFGEDDGNDDGFMSLEFPMFAPQADETKFKKMVEELMLGSKKIFPIAPERTFGATYLYSRRIVSPKFKQGQQMMHVFIDRKENTFGIWGGGVLDATFGGGLKDHPAKVTPNTFCKITYKGKKVIKDAKGSPTDMHDFEIRLPRSEVQKLHLRGAEVQALASRATLPQLPEGNAEG